LVDEGAERDAKVLSKSVHVPASGT
jgi:hypothetical protein